MANNQFYKKNHRRSIRLKEYDYTQQGLYFITICIQNNICLLGNISDGKMKLNRAGEMIEGQWLGLTDHFKHIIIKEFVVMPNHFHAIIEFTQYRSAPCGYSLMPGIEGQPQGIAPTVGDVVGAFKSLSTNEYIQQVKQNNWVRFSKRLWQRNYYEHIIRNEDSHLLISQYIQDNPMKWQEDKYWVPL